MTSLSSAFAKYARPQEFYEVFLPQGEKILFKAPTGSEDYERIQNSAIEFARKVKEGKGGLGIPEMRLGLQTLAHAYVIADRFVSMELPNPDKPEEPQIITSTTQADWIELARERWQLFSGIASGLLAYLDQTVVIRLRADIEEAKKNSEETPNDTPNSFVAPDGIGDTQTKSEETLTQSE